jgi:predicted ATP-grasp superfamily ATP-dependent carboligase
VLAALVRAAHDWQPSILIPGDEPSVRFLHRAVELSRHGGVDVPSGIVSLITRSLGDPAHYATLTNKRLTCELAAELGLRVPRQARVNRLEDAAAFAAAVGWPVVLKQPLGYSGRGVVICRSEQELAAAYRRFTSPVGSHRRFENAYRSLIGDKLGLAWHPTGDAVDIQQYVAGQPAMYNLVAVAGQTVAGFAEHAERINPEPSGPSTVVRFIEHEEMQHTAETLAAHTGLTGFAGFDFVLDRDGGRAYLLECNARPTPTVHLGSHFGVDLCRALFEHMSGGDVTRALTPRGGDTVALFPQEWSRDPHSPFLQSAYHDVPWDDPSLLRAYVDGFSGKVSSPKGCRDTQQSGPLSVTRR